MIVYPFAPVHARLLVRGVVGFRVTKGRGRLRIRLSVSPCDVRPALCASVPSDRLLLSSPCFFLALFLCRSVAADAAAAAVVIVVVVFSVFIIIIYC